MHDMIYKYHIAPDPATTGQAPTASEKMQPEMDSVGGPKARAGEEKK